MNWKRIVHSIITITLIVFLIWYFQQENRIIRKTDVCGYYAYKTNQICACTPIKTGISKTTTFYPNLTFEKTEEYEPR